MQCTCKETIICSEGGGGGKGGAVKVCSAGEFILHVARARENLFSCITTVYCTKAILLEVPMLLKAVV